MVPDSGSLRECTGSLCLEEYRIDQIEWQAGEPASADLARWSGLQHQLRV